MFCTIQAHCSPDETKLVVAELTLDKYIPSLISCYQAIVRSTSDKNPSEFRTIGRSKGRKTRSRSVGSHLPLSSCLSTERCLRRWGRVAIKSGVWSGWNVNKNKPPELVRQTLREQGLFHSSLSTLLKPSDDSSGPVPRFLGQESVVVRVG